MASWPTTSSNCCGRNRLARTRYSVGEESREVEEADDCLVFVLLRTLRAGVDFLLDVFFPTSRSLLMYFRIKSVKPSSSRNVRTRALTSTWRQPCSFQSFFHVPSKSTVDDVFSGNRQFHSVVGKTVHLSLKGKDSDDQSR